MLPPASIALTSLAVHLLMDMPLHLCWNSRCKPLHVIHTCNTGVNDTHQVAVKLFSFKWDASCTCAHAAHRKRERGGKTESPYSESIKMNTHQRTEVHAYLARELPQPNFVKMSHSKNKQMGGDSRVAQQQSCHQNFGSANG